MKLVTAREMKALDVQAQNDYAMPGILLMDNAAQAVAEAVHEALTALDIDSKNILFALVQQLAGTQNVALQLAMEAGAQQRIDKHVCLACCQLCQNPIVLCAQRLHAATSLRKHSQLHSSITLYSIQRSANDKGTHAHAIALQPAE